MIIGNNTVGKFRIYTEDTPDLFDEIYHTKIELIYGTNSTGVDTEIVETTIGFDKGMEAHIKWVNNAITYSGLKSIERYSNEMG